jgi:predicted transposase/invertase (TIGR01784 family)
MINTLEIFSNLWYNICSSTERLKFMNNLDREDEIKEAGSRLGINTTGKLFDPRFDYVFKRIFTAQEEESKIALIDFLNSVLTGKHDNIVDLTVVNNEIPVEAYKEKKSRFDIRVVFENGEQALVEMELKAKDNFVKRSLHNVSRMYSAQPINRMDYRKLKRCYMIGVMGYNVLGRDFGYLNTFTFRDKESRQLSDEMQITYIELEKIGSLLDKRTEELTNGESWAIFLRYASYDDKWQVLEKITQKNGGIKMAVDVLKYISKSDIERMRYEDEILAEIDHEAEVDYRVREEKREIAKKLLKRGIDIKYICEDTGLTIEEIKELQEQT